MSAYPEKVQKANEEVLDTARDVLGGIRGNPKVVDTMLSSASGFTRDGVEYTVRNAFGGIWARDGLELKYRSLSVISILGALGQMSQLKSHVQMGLLNGLKEEEIREALMHVMGYVGFPAGLNAFNAADEVIQAWREEHKQE